MNFFGENHATATVPRWSGVNIIMARRVPATEYRAMEAQVRELQRLLGKKTMENELLREAVSRAADPKILLLRSTSLPEDGRRARSPT